MNESNDSVIELFRRNSAKRIREMREAMQSLTLSMRSDAVEVITRHFHGFSGLGATYGYPLVSELGEVGERSIRAMTELAKTPGRAALTEWEDLVARIEASLDHEPLETASPELETRLPATLTDVLIVEDDESMRISMSLAFQKWGAFVRTASTLEEASTQIEISLPDVLVVDIALPDGTGYEVVEQVRKMEIGSGIVAIVVSARHDFVDRVEAFRCGTDAFFEKPIDFDVLVRRVDRLIEQAQPEGIRILSVEDDPHHIDNLREIFEQAGYHYLNCRDPLEFERYLIEFEPDLVIMDITLQSVVDGYDLSRYVRLNERWASLPVLFLTASKEEGTRVRITEAGGDDYIQKPIQPEVLLATILARVNRARVIRSQIDRDGLTGLLTRTAFFERCETLVKEMLRHSEHEASLVLIDLDHFKRINDQWGHLVGDQVLTSFASFLRRRLRQTDSIGRYGGEEFAVLVNHLDPKQTAQLVERLLEEFGQFRQTVPGDDFKVTFSAGVASFDRGLTVEDTVQRADDALYEAKRGGRSQVVVAGS